MQKRKKILDVGLFLGLLRTYILLNKYFFGIYNIIVHYVHKILHINEILFSGSIIKINTLFILSFLFLFVCCFF